MNFKRQSGEEVSVDLTPLIDVVFLLLIFFMVSTTFTKESHLEIDLPQSSAEPAKPAVKEIEVIINAKGEYAVNDRSLVNNSEDTLKKAVQKLSEGNTKIPFIITADAKTSHEYVVRVMDVAGQLGFVQLSITTQRNKSK
ncbi:MULTISPECIES: biopolymer transporter ExbD [unclassified Oleiphilus]|uniref:ExbD/TolR family protein n=2 Tax=Oleiphilus TaxID=141450 RepID=UPI0007C2A33D|nr:MULTISPECIES: biopolymer transporter ExbD [unclassified Oleiphilus]KZY50236.1 biopolymer transporter ExbD [Oleiphilus sp. HI0050]KZY72922.1 biopolymer transporter ExbD [Oleiphilus sp. HI0068]KZY75627.1 biopolymer transporter ExbD [Oleiphilus sp. HI0069]KZY92081.1 biopolymer transporter ExbD [Oleiphilus sp. HI0072]KZZ09671.1 biopolymer transporter ExbD [Oleiphilus sp. HI0078]KZZ19322.1 biopolymer transporter ExbD [Oleiphilus sp. HI0081]KZZ44090.1 biopolymer transporter ExbD [Oleiphilus sp.